MILGGLTLIATTTAASIFKPAAAKTFTGGTQWLSPGIEPLEPVKGNALVFLSQEEATSVKAIFDRLIPADDLSPAASELGCVRFLDHQLAGAFGQASSDYRSGPVAVGLPFQGPQAVTTPREYYRHGLKALDAACQQLHGAAFHALEPHLQDEVLEGLEANTFKLDNVDGVAFFSLLVQNVREGFLSDPVYGGNQDMEGWKMIGYPGARYDYREWVNRKGEALDIPPISLLDLQS